MNLFDTGRGARALALPSYGLAYALQLYCDFVADKKHQLGDWRVRPLPPEMAKYAQADTHDLLHIYDRCVSALVCDGCACLNADTKISVDSIRCVCCSSEVLRSVEMRQTLMLSDCQNVCYSPYSPMRLHECSHAQTCSNHTECLLTLALHIHVFHVTCHQNEGSPWVATSDH